MAPKPHTSYVDIDIFEKWSTLKLWYDKMMLQANFQSVARIRSEMPTYHELKKKKNYMDFLV